MDYGILTMATPDDYLKAIGFALSARQSNPHVPLAVVCSESLKPYLSPYFDQAIPEHPYLRGFIHKLHMDEYTPFDETFFFDADVFLFKSLSNVYDQWRQNPYSACGVLKTDGIGPFGLDATRVLRYTQKSQMVNIGGAGHAYFRKPECIPVFVRAREVAANYAEIAGNIPLADEDVMNIVLTEFDISPIPHGTFFSRYASARKGTMKMSVADSQCTFIAQDSGTEISPYMMHFAADEAPMVYYQQIRKLYARHSINTDGLLKMTLKDLYRQRVHRTFHRLKKKYFD